MKRAAPLVLLVACSGAPVARPAAAVARPSPVTSVQFTETGLAFWGAVVQPPSASDARGRPLHPAPIDDVKPGSTMGFADVACRVEDVAGHPFRATCENRPAPDDSSERWMRDRWSACFRTTPVALAPRELRTLEASFVRGTTPLLPRMHPETHAPLLMLSVDARQSESTSLEDLAIYDDGCNNVPHPCDPGPRRIVGYRQPDPSKVRTIVVVHHSFGAYGPHGYEYRAGATPRVPLFPSTGTAVVYAVPTRAGRPDARFVAQSYEPLAAIPLEREDQPTQLALVLDRAVLAYAIHDDAAGKQRVRELDAWLAAHSPREAVAPSFAHTLDTLHALARGDFSTTDPCASSTAR